MPVYRQHEFRDGNDNINLAALIHKAKLGLT